MSGWTVVVFGVVAAGVFVAVYGLTRYTCSIEEGHLTIRSSFMGMRGWVYRCPLSNVESFKYPATLFDLGPLGGHVWGRPWATDGLLLRFRKPWWLFRRTFLCTDGAREIAAELERL